MFAYLLYITINEVETLFFPSEQGMGRTADEEDEMKLEHSPIH